MIVYQSGLSFCGAGVSKNLAHAIFFEDLEDDTDLGSRVSRRRTPQMSSSRSEPLEEGRKGGREREREISDEKFLRMGDCVVFWSVGEGTLAYLSSTSLSEDLVVATKSKNKSESLLLFQISLNLLALPLSSFFVNLSLQSLHLRDTSAKTRISGIVEKGR